MKYYKVKSETNQEVLGAFPQLECRAEEYQKYHLNRFENISNWENEHDLPDLNHFILNSNAKLTHNLSNKFVISFRGLFVDIAVRNLLEKFNIPKIILNQIKIKGVDDGSYFLMRFMFLDELIDYKKSEFHYIEAPEKNINFEIDSLESFNKSFLKGLDDYSYSLTPKRLVLKYEIDLFSSLTTGELLCSERLYSELKKFSGFSFISVEYNVEIIS